MESIKKLRYWLAIIMTDDCEGIGYCDAIEREIAERYMPLPVDADGVPIRPDEKLEYRENSKLPGFVVKVDSIRWDGVEWTIENECIEYERELCRHVKPDPVKDLLREFALEIDPGADVDCAGVKAIDEYADKLREVMR